MTELEIAGGIEDAITHFAAHGLAEILTEAGGTTARWGWRDGHPARARVETSLGLDDIGTAVCQHAGRHADESSWVQATAQGRRGVLSPRVAAPKTRDGWRAQERSRVQAIDLATGALDNRFITALGRPAYWNIDTSRPNADAGASRWEMKTRNRGETFVGERLAPLASIVAQRDAVSIVDGLSGRRRVDESGKDKPDSRTATGLVSPRPVDNALAWCALWGLSATAVWWSVEGVGPTTAVMQVGATHPTSALLPVLTSCVTSALFRRIVRSRDWASLCTAVFEAQRRGASFPYAAAAPVVARGIEVAALFRIRKAGSDSAPERFLESGRVVGLRHPGPMVRR